MAMSAYESYLLLLLLGTFGCPACAGSFGVPIAGFGPPVQGIAIVNSTVVLRTTVKSNQACGAECVKTPGCIAITWYPSQSKCVGSGWSNWYTMEPVASPSTVTYTRIRHLDKASVVPEIEMALTVPTYGVQLQAGGLFKNAFDANVEYLMQFPADDLLFWFRKRKGLPTGDGSSWGWDRYVHIVFIQKNIYNVKMRQVHCIIEVLS